MGGGKSSIPHVLRHWDPDLRVPSARTGLDDFLAEERLLPPSSVRAEAKEAVSCAGGEKALPVAEGVFFVSASPSDVVRCLSMTLPLSQQPPDVTYPYTPQLLDGLHILENDCLSASTIASFAQPDGAVMQAVTGQTTSEAKTSPTQWGPPITLTAARRLHEGLLERVEMALVAGAGEGLQHGGSATHVFTATEDELFDRGALRALARKRGGAPVGHSPGVLRAFYAAVEGRATNSPLLYGSCLTVQEPVTFHLLAQYCRSVTGLDAEGAAAAFLPEPPASQTGEGHRQRVLWHAALPSATLATNMAVLVPRTFVLLSRYPCFEEQQRSLRFLARGWQSRVAGELRTLLGLVSPPPHYVLGSSEESRADGPVSTQPAADLCRWQPDTGTDSAVASPSPLNPSLGRAREAGSSESSPAPSTPVGGPPGSADCVGPALIASVVSQGTYRWELACRLHRLQRELQALETEHSSHPPAPLQTQLTASGQNGGVTPAGKRGIMPGLGQLPGPGHPPSPAAAGGNPGRAAVPSPAAGSAGSAGTPTASGARVPGQPFLSFTERSRYEARLRDLSTQASRLGLLLADVTRRLRVAGQMLLSYCVRKAFERPLQGSLSTITELLSLQAPRPGERVAAASAGFAFTRPQLPWSFAEASYGSRDAAAGGQLVRLLRCFVEEVAPFDPGPHNISQRVDSAAGCGAGLDSPLHAWQLGCDVRHPETLHALRAWALPLLCSLLTPSALVDVLAAALTEHNVVFVAEAPFDDDVLPPGDSRDPPPRRGQRPTVDGASLSRCVLGLSCCLSPLAWEQNLRPSVPLATAQALLAAGPDVLAQTNLLGVRSMGNLPSAAPPAAVAPIEAVPVSAIGTKLGQPASAGTPSNPPPTGTPRSTSAGFVGGTPGSSPPATAEPPAYPPVRAHSVSFSFSGAGRSPQPAAAPPAHAAGVPAPAVAVEAHGRRRSLDLSSIMASLTPAAKPAVPQVSAAQRTATQRSAAAAAAELVLVSVASGRAYLYGEAGGHPVSASASLPTSPCHLPGRDNLVAAVQRAYGDAFATPGQVNVRNVHVKAGPDAWSTAQIAAADAVADAVSAHIRWMLVTLYVAALPPLLLARGAAAANNSVGGGTLPPPPRDPPYHRPSPPDADSAARADLLAHLPSAKQLQRTSLATIPFWRRFSETQILHQHHQMRAGRAYSAAFRGTEPTLLSNSSDLIVAALQGAVQPSAASDALSPPLLLVAPSPLP